jgi:hypothetical protein
MGIGIRAVARREPGRIACVAALAGTLLTLAAAAPADAGTYTVWSCRGPGGEPLSTQAWSLSTFDEPAGGGIVLDDACATGGALTLAISPRVNFAPPLKPTAIATLTPPSGVRIVDYTLRRSLRTAPAGLLSDFYYAAGVRERAGGVPTVRGCASLSDPPTYTCTTSGNADDPDHPANVYDRSGLQLDRLELFAGCTTDGCTGLLPLLRDDEVAGELKLFGARVELSDTEAPQVASLGGPLAGASPVSGSATLVVGAGDAGAGVAAVTLSIDGGPPQTQASTSPDGVCQTPYTRVQPCPTEVTRAFTVETGELAPGAHSASGTVVDAAGNVANFGPLAFTVASPPEPPPAPPPIVIPPPDPPDLRNGRPAVARPQLTLARTQIEHVAGSPAWIAGMLRTNAGEPIVGARLTLTADPIGRGAGEERALGSVTTARGGRFRARVDSAGAQRVTVAFAPTLGGAPTMRATAIVRERTQLSIARSRARVGRGGAVVLSGRLSGAGAAAGRAVVEVQAVVSGRWRAVETVHTSPDGRYRWRYRFRYVTRDTVFSFRTLVRRTTGWPWPTLHSPMIRVRVDGA